MHPKLSPIAQWLSSILLLIIAGIGLTACAILPPPIANLIPSPTPPPTSTPTPSPTATPTATPTPTPQPIVRVQEADHELFNGNWDEARNLYSTALDQQPDPAVAAAARFGLATVNLRAGNIESAAGDFTLYLQAYATDSRIPDAYFQLGNIAQAQGTWGVAIQNYQQYLALRPGVIDSYVWERIGRCYIEWGKPTSAVEAYSQAILTDRAGGLTPLIEKKADLLQQQGDYAGALALYDLVATSTDSHLTLARMDILRGRMNLLLGHTEQAQQFFQHAVDTYPETYDSYRSLIALIDAGVTVNEFQRGLINYYAGQNELALAAFNRYIAATPTPEAGVYYYAGLARRALNQPTGAIANFDQLIEHDPQSPLWAEAWTEKAYTQWAWADDYNGAIATLEKFATAAPENAAVPDALFQAGRIAERQGNLSRAAALWTSVNTRYPNTATAAEGAFFAGVSLYREASYDLAVAQFTLAAEHPAANAERKAAAWLWLAKTQRQRGATEAAATAFGQAEAADPGGYYSLRATEIKEDEAPFPPVTTYDLSFDYLKEKSEAEAWLAAKLGLDPSRDLGALSPQLAADGHWLRGHELWALGLTAEAKLEFSELRQAYASDPLLLYQLALALRELGAYSETINAARASVDALGFTDSFAAPPFFTHLRFGAYYFDLVTKAATDYDLDPLLLYAVIRKESLFEGSIVSSASAQGLMQVIPTTGEWVAQQLHWPHYQNSDLYRPYINVEFGAYYLDYQRDYLGGNIVAALAAYNAGPGNAEKWWAASHDDPDLFLEITRLDEPRRYIRSIYEFYEIYRKLYGK